MRSLRKLTGRRKAVEDEFAGSSGDDDDDE